MSAPSPVPPRADAVEIVEVGPRDGLQNDPSRLTTDQKLDFIARLTAAGVRRMEVASFVHPKLVPAMADSADVMARVPRNDGVTHIGLALNETGVRRAIEAQVDEINYVLVASSGFGQANQKADPLDTADGFDRAAALARDAGRPIAATISVAFGDPFDGEVDPGMLETLAGRAAAAGAMEIALGDTIGVADPWTVRDRIRRILAAAPGVRLRLHFHNTRNTAMANIYAALEEGAAVFDASCGGIGGCPFAPKATGNVATEDVVYMLDRAGVATGIDLDAMIETAHWLAGALDHPIDSLLSRAGPFRAMGAKAPAA